VKKDDGNGKDGDESGDGKPATAKTTSGGVVRGVLNSLGNLAKWS
jgi:hypothetical protein